MTTTREQQDWEIQPEVSELLHRVLVRARDEAMRDAGDRVKRARHKASANGMVRSSNTLDEATEIYLGALASAATRSRTEMLESVRNVYGGVDADHASFVLVQVQELVDRLADGIGRQAKELLAGRGFDPPAAAVDATVRQFQKAALDLKRDAEIAIEPLILRERLGAMSRQIRFAANTAGVEYDLFVSYAGEDDAVLVHPLVDELQRRNLAVWYAGQQLSMGDSLASKINDGLAHSRYGVVILSPAFLAKNWPMFELQTLVAIAASVGRKKLLPVWHGVSHDDLIARLPTIAGLVGVPSSVGVLQLADQIEAGMT